MSDYLVTYRPLIETDAGAQAVERYGLPPYIDASCRREPDLAHAMPAITALCRGAMLAPRLRVNDRAATPPEWALRPEKWTLSHRPRAIGRGGLLAAEQRPEDPPDDVLAGLRGDHLAAGPDRLLHLALLRARMATTNEDGTSAIEYALIASGIGAAVAATVWSLGATTAGFYQSLAGLLP